MRLQRYSLDNILKNKVASIIKESVYLKKTLLEDMFVDNIIELSDAVIHSMESGCKVILFGNGGSAADAQHIAAELVGRFKNERKALAAISLATDTSILTCLGNDYGFERVFSRQIEAIGKKNDLAIAISTSGNSLNVIRAVEVAREKGLTTACLSGGSGGRLSKLVDIAIVVPSKNTPRIQEMHIMIGHIVCELVEEVLLPKR